MSSIYLIAHETLAYAKQNFCVEFIRKFFWMKSLKFITHGSIWLRRFGRLSSSSSSSFTELVSDVVSSDNTAAFMIILTDWIWKQSINDKNGFFYGIA